MDEAKIAQFLTDHEISTEIKLVGYTRSEMDGKWVYNPWKNNRFDVWVHYGKKKRLIPVYENISKQKLSEMEAMYNILSQLRDLGIYSSFKYWFEESGGKELYESFLETKEENETRQEIYGYIQRMYRYQKNIENKLLDLLGKELYEQFYQLSEDD